MSGGSPGSSIVPERIAESFLLKFGVALGLVLLATGSVGVYAYTQTDRILDSQVETELRTDASDEATDVENWLDERRRLARMLSEYDPMTKDAAESVSLFLQRELNDLPEDVYRIHLVNASSRTVFATNAPLLVNRTLPKKTPWNELAFGFSQEDDQVYRSRVYVSDGVPVVAFVTPVPNRPNRYLVLTAEPGAITDRFDKAIPGTFTQVVDGDGTVVIDERRRATLSPYVEGGRSPVVGADGNGSREFWEDAPKEATLDGEYVLASEAVEGTDWTVVVHAPANAAYHLRRTVTLHLLGLLGVAFVGVLVIGLTIGRNTVSALEDLSTKARALARGDLEVSLETDRRDEIGDLVTAFASMRDSLRDRIDRLSEARDEAEHARSELAESNRDLEEQRVIISVLNRLLTHNLRNSTSIVLGQAETLMHDLSEERAERAEAIYHTMEVTLRRIEKSKRVEQVVRSEDPLEPIDVTDVVEGVVEQFRQQYPEATVRVDAPGECTALTNDAIGFVVDNLVENAIEHNDRPDPAVAVVVDAVGGGESVEIRIEDDGPGIPDMETDVLDQDRETKLSHGSGMGLWLVNWLIEQMGGDLTFEDRDPRGTVAIVRLQSE